MGRSCAIYGMHFAQMKTVLSSALNDEFLSERLHSLSSLYPNHHSLEDLKLLINSNPEQLNQHDIGWLIIALSDPMFKGKRDKHRNKLPDLLEAGGIYSLHDISITNPCCVLMEIFFDWTANKKDDLPDSEDGMYLFTQKQFLSFAERMALTGHYFEHRQEASFPLFKAISNEGREFEKMLEGFYQRELKAREADRSHYEAKWSCDYFSYTWNYSAFFSEHLQGKKFFDRYLLYDSV